MTSGSDERWPSIQRLFAEALEMTRSERGAMLGRLASQDEGLAEELRSLLQAHEQAGPVDAPPSSLIGSVAEELTRGLDEGQRIGPFRVTREIGHGGMGDVYLAERTDADFRQRVALKLVRSGFDSDTLRDRFLNERRILAALEHPGIARLVDGGMTARGRPWFAMEFVEGTPVVGFCDQRGMPVGERLRLFGRICEAVQYAHRNLVVHRDIKPGNILVTEHGEPKLLDFGVAKILSEGVDQTSGTRTGQWLTPEYASPEQIRGEAVTTVSDVYALGVLLYELLTGQRPYRLAGLTAHEIADTLDGTEPERPSTVISRTALGMGEEPAPDEPTALSVSGARATSPDQLRRMLSGDLDTIVLKAIHRDPSRRYDSVDRLAEDVRRYLAGEPILARPDTFGYRAAKFVRRNRVAVASTAVVVLSLLGGLAGTLSQASLARAEALAAEAERDRAENEAIRAERAAEMVIDLFRMSDPGETRGQDITARELLDRGAARVETELSDEPALQAELLGELGGIYLNLGIFARARDLFERALALRLDLHGEDHADVAASLVDLGAALEAQGELPAATARLEEALAILDRSEDPSVSLQGDAYHHLGEVHRLSGQYEAAEASYGAALELRRASLKADDPEVAETLFGLAAALHDRGRYDRSEGLFREALDIFRARPGAPHPLAIRALLNVGSVSVARALYDEAEPVMREALTLSVQVYGEEHPATIEAETGIGTILFNTGRYVEAEALLRGTVPKAERVLGEAHISVVIVRQVFAMTLSAVGRGAQSVELLERNLTHMGPGHPIEVLAHLLLSDVHLERGAYDRGRREAEEGLRIARERFGDEHAYVALGTLQLADFDRAEAQWQDAETRYRAATELAERVLSEGHRYVIRGRIGIGWVRLATGDLAEAEGLFLDALEVKRATLPAGHPELAEPLLGLARIDMRRGDLTGAEARLEEALSIRRSAYPVDHPRILEIEVALEETRGDGSGANGGAPVS